MSITINEDALFTTSETERMIGVEGLTTDRIRLLCERGKVPGARKTGNAGSKWTHWRIPFKSFDKLVLAHNTHRTIGRKADQRGPSMEQFNELFDRVTILEGILDEYTQPESV